jgi:hypothetical protein
MRLLLPFGLLAACVVQPASPPGPRYAGSGGTPPPYAGGDSRPATQAGAYSNCGGGNLALGKPARQSSQSTWSKPNDSQGAVDGIKNGGFGFHTENEARPWWEVDLGQSCAIGQIVLYNRLDCCADRAGSLSISVSSGNGDWETIYTHSGASFGGTDGRPLVIDAGSRTARIVRVQLSATAYLHLDEVEIFGAGSGAVASPQPVSPPATNPVTPPSQPTLASCGPGNIALGRPARQSSQSQWSNANDAQGAVDGKKTNGFGFHTATESQPWWEVDLGRVCPLGRLRVYNRMDCCGERARSLQVLLSSDGGGTWQTAYRHDGSAFGGNDGRPLVVDLGGKPGRIVRIQLTTNDYLHFDEVELESR